MNRLTKMDPFQRFWPIAVVAPLLILGLSTQALAQLKPSNQRSTFPGRRIGGGTRAVCSSRPLAHLVPNDNVYVPDSTRLIGLLEGPTQSPVPLMLVFRSEGDSASASSQTSIPTDPESSRLLPASEIGITLISSPPLKPGPLVWESSYQCGGENATTSSSDQLDFISAVSPSPLTLLEFNISPQQSDLDVQKSLRKLQGSCGESFASSEVAGLFDLSDIITDEWPDLLPVRCVK